MTKEEFAARTDEIKTKLFKTAMVYLKNEHDALEAVDETVYRGLCAVKKRIYHGRNGPHSPNTSGNGSHKAEKSPRTVKACPGRGKLRKGGKKWITEIELTSE